jgi:hypothetical protein
MSWSFDIRAASDKDAAKAQVQERADASGGHFPPSAQAVVNAVIDALPECENSVLNVRSYGHFATGDYRGTSNMLVEISSHFAENIKPAEQAA